MWPSVNQHKQLESILVGQIPFTPEHQDAPKLVIPRCRRRFTSNRSQSSRRCAAACGRHCRLVRAGLITGWDGHFLCLLMSLCLRHFTEVVVRKDAALGWLPQVQESGLDPYKQQRIKLGGLVEHLETIRRCSAVCAAERAARSSQWHCSA